MEEGRYLIFKAENKKQAYIFDRHIILTHGNFKWYKFNATENSFYFCVNFLSEIGIERFKTRLEQEILLPNNISGEIIIQKQHQLQNQ